MDAVTGEEVEDDETAGLPSDSVRARDAAGMKTSLEGAEVEATFSPDHELVVEHDVAVQRAQPQRRPRDSSG